MRYIVQIVVLKRETVSFRKVLIIKEVTEELKNVLSIGQAQKVSI